MGRIFAIPVFIVVFLLDYRYAATVIFVLAALTDMLDGHIARKHNLVTNFGKLMDPLADKLLVMSALICLAQVGDVAGWMVIVILGREFIITGMRQVAAAQGIVIADGTTGKIKTITTDNGVEFAAHEIISKSLGVPVYFADPYYSWQKGAIENVNGLVRQYIPKSAAFSNFSQQKITKFTAKINERPRKKLNFSTPKECFYKNIS